MDKRTDAIATAPINKEHLKEANIHISVTRRYWQTYEHGRPLTMFETDS